MHDRQSERSGELLHRNWRDTAFEAPTPSLAFAAGRKIGHRNAAVEYRNLHFVRAHADAAHLERQIESAERHMQHFAAFDAQLRRSRVIAAPRQTAIDAKYRKATSLVLERNALEREINCGKSAITHLDGDVRAAFGA